MTSKMSSKNDFKLIYFSRPPAGFFFLEKPMGKSRFCVPEGIGLNIQDGTRFGTLNQEGILKMSSWKRVPKWCRPEILIREVPQRIFLRFPKVFVSFAPENGFGNKNPVGWPCWTTATANGSRLRVLIYLSYSSLVGI